MRVIASTLLVAIACLLVLGVSMASIPPSSVVTGGNDFFSEVVLSGACTFDSRAGSTIAIESDDSAACLENTPASTQAKLYFGPNATRICYHRTYESPNNGDWHIIGRTVLIDGAGTGFIPEEIHCIIDPADGDADDTMQLTVQECDSTADNCAATEGAITCSNTGAADDGTIDDAAIDYNDYIAVSLGAIGGSVGTVDQLYVGICGQRPQMFRSGPPPEWP